MSKTIVITGGTSGIGRVAARTLAAGGARVILIARDAKRADAALDELRSARPELEHRAYFADLSLIAETRRVGAEIAAAEPEIDVLINNAGAIFQYRELTSEGIEQTFATNHLAYFVLTHELLGPLRAAKNARVVNTSSRAHMEGEIDFEDLMLEREYRAMRAYRRSKLCNILFTRELARKLENDKIGAYCFHPGFVATRFGDSNPGWFGWIIKLMKLTAITEEEGASTLIYLASAENPGPNGAYYYERRPHETQVLAKDDALARRLWQESERLTGIQW